MLASMTIELLGLGSLVMAMLPVEALAAAPPPLLPAARGKAAVAFIDISWAAAPIVTFGGGVSGGSGARRGLATENLALMPAAMWSATRHSSSKSPACFQAGARGVVVS
ncbi:hypothetical protein Vafri_21087 [Volvox africanus]|uniref:Secreted protein n=1 Tax=Volvox africanus TaxID=51714 RepID=A0A8J4BSZ3_9CHLO|nr:hypothetical protein Vafri_21087 [Volvox africanus]